MPVADQWIAHGRAKARIEVVECFLSVGVTWEVIEAASGLTETGLQAVKAGAAHLQLNLSKGVGGRRPKSPARRRDSCTTWPARDSSSHRDGKNGMNWR